MEYRVFHPIVDTYGGPVLVALFAALLFVEHRWSLRRWVRGFAARLRTNVGVAVPTFLVMRLALIPASVAAAYWAQQNRFGLLHLVPLPTWARGALAFLLLDYLLYLWHVLSHRVPFLWRFHNVHHTDPDLGVSTALRFHFGEMLLSGVFRVAGVLLIGAGPVAVLVYEAVFEASVAFHHSNWRLPLWLERPLSRALVTPRMHGIHHSAVRREADSNYSNLFNVWDRVHRTLRLDVPQDRITVGVPGVPRRRRPDHLRPARPAVPPPAGLLDGAGRHPAGPPERGRRGRAATLRWSAAGRSRPRLYGRPRRRRPLSARRHKGDRHARAGRASAVAAVR